MSTNSRTYDFVNHSYDYRPNLTPFGSVTIIDFYQKTNRRVMSSKGHRSVVKEFIVFWYFKAHSKKDFLKGKKSVSSYKINALFNRFR